ncbi:MAG TPA: hypothetical protein VK020_08290, partial [Microlunatus sp.]|nr:hypothetical protein [Microlunatus sp.]
LDWRPQSTAYVALYDRLLRRAERDLPPAPVEDDPERVRPDPTFDELGRRYVDLDDETELRRFIRERSTP